MHARAKLNKAHLAKLIQDETDRIARSQELLDPAYRGPRASDAHLAFGVAENHKAIACLRFALGLDGAREAIDASVATLSRLAPALIDPVPWSYVEWLGVICASSTKNVAILREIGREQIHTADLIDHLAEPAVAVALAIKAGVFDDPSAPELLDRATAALQAAAPRLPLDIEQHQATLLGLARAVHQRDPAAITAAIAQRTAYVATGYRGDERYLDEALLDFAGLAAIFPARDLCRNLGLRGPYLPTELLN